MEFMGYKTETAILQDRQIFFSRILVRVQAADDPHDRNFVSDLTWRLSPDRLIYAWICKPPWADPSREKFHIGLGLVSIQSSIS